MVDDDISHNANNLFKDQKVVIMHHKKMKGIKSRIFLPILAKIS